MTHVEGWLGSPPAWLARPEPTLLPHELLVEIEAAVVGAPELRGLGVGRFVPGGAAVGIVAAAGVAATDRLGQRVLVGPVSACGECELCSRGRPTMCPARKRPGSERDGALASHVVADARWTCALAGPLAGAVPGPAAAILVREAALAHEMIARAGVAPGETTIWLGGGPIGHLGGELARAQGAVAVTLTPDELSLPPDDLAAALAARVTGARPWKVFEVSGRGASRRRALAVAAAGTTLVLAGGEAVGADAFHDSGLDGVALSAALDRDVTTIGVAGGHPDLVPELVALAVRGEIDLTAAVDLSPWHALPDVVNALRTGGVGDRAQIVVRAASLPLR